MQRSLVLHYGCYHSEELISARDCIANEDMGEEQEEGGVCV